MLLERLKHETRQLHARVERGLNPLRPDLRADEYAGLLSRFFGLHKQWEQQVDAVEPDWLAGRHKAVLIEEDLRALRYPRSAIASLPLCTCLPPLRTRAQIAGSMYVVEGSTLGGQILARHFHPYPTNFFSGYAAGTGHMWRACCELLESQPVASHDAIAESAILTFDSIGRWMIPSWEPI